MNDKKKKFLREGLEVILDDIINSMPDNPTFVGIGIGVVYIPVGERGDSQVVSGYRIDDNFMHQVDSMLKDIGETFLHHGGVIVLPIEKFRDN